MKKLSKKTSRALVVLALFLLGTPCNEGLAAYSSRGSIALSASVTIGANGNGGGPLLIEAGQMPTEAFFGSNVMVPVRITAQTGTINPNNLRVDIVYQLTDASGAVLGPPISVVIPFIPGPVSGKSISGTAVVNRTDLAALRTGGRFLYLFRARQGNTDSVLGSNGQFTGAAGAPVLATPFATAIIDQICGTVGPAGARVSAPDLTSVDGQTAVVLGPNAVTSAGTLCIKIENNSPYSTGPNGSQAAAIYSIDLQGTSLVAPAQLVFNYPADLQGKVLGSGADAGTLGLYWLDTSRMGGDWRVISRSTLDTTLHTVTGQTGHFSTYGLFPAGAIGASQLRPAERIITPNGDTINDRAVFGTGIEEVKIFDVRGHPVKSIPGPAPAWDGTDDSGAIVESGVYLYQFTSGGDRVSGVIGVAK